MSPFISTNHSTDGGSMSFVNSCYCEVFRVGFSWGTRHIFTVPSHEVSGKKGNFCVRELPEGVVLVPANYSICRCFFHLGFLTNSFLRRTCSALCEVLSLENYISLVCFLLTLRYHLVRIHCCYCKHVPYQFRLSVLCTWYTFILIIIYSPLSLTFVYV